MGRKRQNVSVSRVERGDRIQWVVNWYVLDRRTRRVYKTKKDAENAAAELRISALAGVIMTPEEIAESSRLVAWCRRNGVAIWDLVRHYERSSVSSRPLASKAIAEVVEELLEFKSNAGRSRRYIAASRILLRGFTMGREKQAISEITTEDIEGFLSSRSPASYSKLRALISMVMGFARKRGYVRDNPCDLLEKPRYIRPKPLILTIGQVEKALEWFRENPRAMGWFILSTFCGLRPEEADQTRWEFIRDNHVEVDAQTSKRRQRRLVYPMPMALVWIAEARNLGAELPIGRFARLRITSKLARVLGFTKGWPKVVTRHTAASYWLAATNDAKLVAHQLGHRVEELERSYKELVRREDAERFWKILPSLTNPPK